MVWVALCIVVIGACVRLWLLCASNKITALNSELGLLLSQGLILGFLLDQSGSVYIGIFIFIVLIETIIFRRRINRKSIDKF